MNSIKILHAVRSAITAIAELLVLFQGHTCQIGLCLFALLCCVLLVDELIWGDRGWVTLYFTFTFSVVVQIGTSISALRHHQIISHWCCIKPKNTSSRQVCTAQQHRCWENASSASGHSGNLHLDLDHSRQGLRTEALHRRGARLWCDVTGQSALRQC